MNSVNNMKARMFDLLDDNRKLEKRISLLTEDVEERDETIEELRGEILMLRNLAERRGDMVRGLLNENKKMRVELQTPAQTISKADVATIQEETIEHIIEVVRNSFKPTPIVRGFDF